MTPAGNGLEAPQSLAASSASATPTPDRKNAQNGPCGARRATVPDACGVAVGYRSSQRALKSRYLGAVARRGAGVAAHGAAPDSLNKEHKVKKPSIHAGSRGGGR